jgi:hypothetical protein
VPGPLTTIDGQRVLVKRVSTTEPGAEDGAAAFRIDAGDGPVWILAYEPLEPEPVEPGPVEPEPVEAQPQP